MDKDTAKTLIFEEFPFDGTDPNVVAAMRSAAWFGFKLAERV